MSLDTYSRIQKLSEKAALQTSVEPLQEAPEIFHQHHELLSSEAGELYRHAAEVRDAALIHEKCLVTRASPLLSNLPSLGIQAAPGALRDYESQFGNRASRYTTPGSVSSMFSPAAYLTALYRNARQLYPEQSPWHLDQRRPDLQQLTLDTRNMTAVVPALSLSNEVLMAQARSVLDKDSDSAVLEHLYTDRSSAGTPWHDAHGRLQQAWGLLDGDRHLDANPLVARLFGATARAGMTCAISPALREILNEPLNAQSYKKNFGEVAPESFLQPQNLQRFYGLSAQEYAQFASVAPAITADYVNGVLVTQVGAKLYRLRCLSVDSDLNFARLYPQTDGSYKLQLNWSRDAARQVQIMVQLDGGGNSLVAGYTFADLQAGVTYEYTIAAGQLPEGRAFSLSCRAKAIVDTLLSASAQIRIEVIAPPTQALLLNKAIRTWRATGLAPEVVRAIIEEPEPEPRLFQLQRCMSRDELAAEDALVVTGGELSQSASATDVSQFDRVFNEPVLGDRPFLPGTVMVDVSPNQAASHRAEKAVLKRALQVDELGLVALVTILNNSTSIVLSLHYLSRLYALSCWARLHGLTAGDLKALIGLAGVTLAAGASPGAWAQTLHELSDTLDWLRERQWSVADLRLMLQGAPAQKTPEAVALFNAFREAVASRPTATSAEKLALLAPHVAAAFQLPSAEVGSTLLVWCDGLAISGLTLERTWSLLASPENVAQSAFPFIYWLAQLGLVYRASGSSPQALALFVHTPARLVSGEPRVLPLSLESIKGLQGFSAWLKGLGEGADRVLSAFSADTLDAHTLAQALDVELTSVQQAIAQAVKHGQVAQASRLGSWAQVDATCQWLALSQACGLAPESLGACIALDYRQDSPAVRAHWQQVADAFAAALTPQQSADLARGRALQLSAALSGCLLGSHWAGILSHASREQLYQYLLADNLNGTQVDTSRLAEAIVSLQTFIQRTLSAPEGEVNQAALTTQFFTDWEQYNQRYSTWAGAAKLLYYPENYIDPTVRLGQTQMMDEMLQTLGQSQLNEDTIGDAFHTYLTGFEEVANLRVISGYHDNLDAREGKSYLIGANQSEPREFFWRSVDEARRNSEGQLPANAWSDWRKVGGSPQPWGDCIRPVMYKSRLYLCWLERQDVTPPTANGQPGTVKQYRHEIKVAYLRYDGNWSTPNVIDVTAPIQVMELGNEAPGLYCSHFQAQASMPVLLYRKQASYAANQPANSHLLYVHDDMSIAHQTAAAARGFIEYMRQELDTTTSVMVNNRYAQGLQVENALANRVVQGSTYGINGAVSSVKVDLNGAAGEVKLSLQGQLDCTLNPVGHELGALIGRIPELKAASQLYYCAPYGGTRIGMVRHNGFFYLASAEAFGTPSSMRIRYDLSSPEIQLTKTQSLTYTDSVTRVLYKIAVFRDPQPTRPIPKGIYPVQVDILEQAYLRYILDTDNAALLDNPYSSIDPGSVSIEFFDGKTRTTFPASQHVKPLPPFNPSGTMSYVFPDLADIPVRKDWGGRNELLLDVTFKVGGADYARYTLRLYRSAQDPQNVIRLGTTSEHAQYMELGPYRTRLNTLFARQLVERAGAGIDTILSYETQQIKEPKLGQGFYTTLTLPKYKPSVHGDEPWVKIYYTYFYANNDAFPIWSGRLSPDELTQVTLFVPRPAKGWAQTHTAHLQVAYKKAANTAVSGRSVMFAYNPATDTAVVTRPGSSALSKDIVENVTLRDSLPMDFGGANALYFWELFYYTPMMMAQRLLQEQQFDLAARWLRYVWDPTGYVVRGQKEQRYWNVRPLQEDTRWNDAPLRAVDPDAVAQNDPMHYKVATFMRGLDLLLARGDAAYRRLERDTLTEAKVWYSQALNLLGEQAYIEADRGWSAPTLSQAGSQAAAARHLEVLCLLCDGRAGDLKAMAPASAIEFLPEVNDVMQGYWLTLRQRLFNLRHNLTLDGQPLQLPLFAKPVDPKALLNAAVAAQSGAGAGLAPVDLPLWRFEPMLASARDLVSRLIQFGAALQGVLERKDAESLNALLQNHGLELMGSSLRLQENLGQELEAERTLLHGALAGARQRLESYTRVYDENVNAGEQAALLLAGTSKALTVTGKAAHMTAAALDVAPNIFGLASGGMQFGSIANAVGIGVTLTAEAALATSGQMLQVEAFRRRRQDWERQRDIAQHDVEHVEAQLAALDVRCESARLQAGYLKTQQRQLRVGLDFLQSKFTNQALYSWMRGRLASIYFQFYDIAASRCLMAERAWQWQSGETRTFIKGGGWQGTWAGLTCGEGLMLNLAQLEAAHIKSARRALEVTRTVSLGELYRSDRLPQAQRFELAAAVAAMVEGRQTEAGTVANGLRLESGELIARVNLPDLAIATDYPAGLGGRRRVKQIRVSLPALLGPYQNLQAVLGYTGGQPLPPGCERMAISQGLNDSGLFQPGADDGRWLPFEGADVADGGLALRFAHARGKQLEVLKTLSDIILHIDYTIAP